jgi:hypothetical protein
MARTRKQSRSPEIFPHLQDHSSAALTRPATRPGGAKVTTGAPNFDRPLCPAAWPRNLGDTQRRWLQRLSTASALNRRRRNQAWHNCCWPSIWLFPVCRGLPMLSLVNEIVTAETDASATYYLALTVTQGTGTIAWRSEMPAPAPNQGYRMGYRPLTRRAQNPRFCSFIPRGLIPPPRFEILPWNPNPSCRAGCSPRSSSAASSRSPAQ